MMASTIAVQAPAKQQQSSTAKLINALAARCKKIVAASYWFGVAGCTCLAIGVIVFWPTASSSAMLGYGKGIAVPNDFALWALKYPETKGFINALGSSGFHHGPRAEGWFGIMFLVLSVGIIWLTGYICRKRSWNSIWRLPIVAAFGILVLICFSLVTKSTKWSLREYYPQESSYQIGKEQVMSEAQFRYDEAMDQEKTERSLERISLEDQIAAVVQTAERGSSNGVTAKRLLDIALQSGADSLDDKEKGALYGFLHDVRMEQRINALDIRVKHLPLSDNSGPLKGEAKFNFAKTSYDMGRSYKLLISNEKFPKRYADQANYLLAQHYYDGTTRAQVAYHLSQLTGTWSPQDEFTKTRIGILYEFASFRGKGAYPWKQYHQPDLSVAKAIADGRPYQRLRGATAKWLYTLGAVLIFIAAWLLLLATKRWSVIRRLEARYRLVLKQKNHEIIHAI